MMGYAIFLSHAVVAAFALLWGFDYGSRVGDSRGVIGYALAAGVLASGAVWALVVPSAA